MARRAGLWSLPGPLIWLVQAALIASAISGLMGAGGVAPLLAGFAVLALALLRAAIEARALALAQRLSARLRHQLRARLIGHALRQSPGAEAEDPGGLASLMGEGVAQIGPWVERFRPAMLRARVLPLLILALVASQSWAAALALALTGPLIPLFMALVGWAAQAAAQAHLVETGALNRVLMDRVAALVDLRLLGAGATAQADLAQRSDSLRARTMKVLRLAFLSSAVLEFFAALGVALVAVHVGLSLLGLIGWGSWGQGLTAFGGIFILLIVPEFYQPLRDLAAAWHDRAAAEAAATSLDARLADKAQILGDGAPAPALHGALVWQGLRLGRDVALPDGWVSPGEAVALTGPSGSGKTSLLLALAGLLPAIAGQITRGDVALTAATADAQRAGLTLIPQHPRFPAGPLRAWLVPKGLAPDALPEADLWQALRAAGADHVLRGLPGGLSAELGETGGGVSGGEARRLMIARALLSPPALVLADEPTADLDPATAAQVTSALLALRDRGCGLLIATHDPALIAALDRAIPLQGGTA